MIVWFNENASSKDMVGGKGLNLSQMYKAAVNVPNGFIVSTEAYNLYISQNNLKSKIEEVLKHTHTNSEKSKVIKGFFSIDKMTDGLKQSVLEAFDKLSAKRVAVRSSSPMEDLSDMSFAGQYTSYLGVLREDVLESVVKCWQSLWNERAISYRQHHESEKALSHAVVIQSMVASSVSGVMFTANPINGLRSETVINASYGLGEAIVSGEVMPDEYVYSLESETPVIKTLHSKKVKYEYAESGVVKVDVAQEMKEEAALTLSEIELLVKTGKMLQDYFEAPQDVEFAFDAKGDLFILQSRDITTLYPVDHFDHDGKLRAYLSANSVLLGMKEPFTPLGADVYGGMFPSLIEVMTKSKKKIPGTFVKYAGGRIFVDITYLMASKFISKKFASVFSGADLPFKGTMDQVIDKHGYTFTHQGIKFKIPWGILKYGLSMIKPYRVASKFKGQDKYKDVKRLGEETIGGLNTRTKSLNTLTEKINFSTEVMMTVFKLTQKQGMYCTEVNGYPRIEKK